MKRIVLAALLIAFATASHAARQDLDYERLRASLNALAADPVLGNLAPAERALAEQAVQTLNDSSGGKGEHAHRLYIAERRVDIAYAAAQAVDAERRVAQLDRDHDRILLEASRREAENARMEAEKQRIQSMLQAEESDRLRAQGEENAQAAEAARAQAAQTQRLADAQAKEAELSRKEAQLAELAAADLRGRLQNMRATRGAEGMQMTLDDIAFAPGRAALRPEAKASLGKLVAFVNRDPAKPIRIEGHTDSRGNPNANQMLSQRRADSVRDALIAAGVTANRMTSIGLGEDQPVADNQTEEGRAKNRRVDVILEDQPH
ncbi:MAG TPA: OmpA family protein [Rudaea sp.]|jgi:outer membrane protein OmpA-like peptidoglycan-associated protein|nr:OmpA family protein [Rudaea sp.]